MRIAHFSDIHATRSPFADGQLTGKRWVGTFNRVVGGRGRHFKDVEERIRALLDDIDQQGVDHLVCTGDVTQMSYPAEYDDVSALLGGRLQQPERLSVVPGNHDRYTHADAQLFEAHFGAVCEGGQFPFRKTLADGVVLIGLDSARPCSLADSSGLCGEEQLQKLQSLLDATGDDDVVIVALHYGLLTHKGLPDKPRHGLRDAEQLMQMLQGKASMVLHGHLHQAYTHYTTLSAEGVLQKTTEDIGLLEICAGSATDLHKKCTYHILEVDKETGVVQLQTRARQPDGRYRPVSDQTLTCRKNA